VLQLSPLTRTWSLQAVTAAVTYQGSCLAMAYLCTGGAGPIFHESEIAADAAADAAAAAAAAAAAFWLGSSAYHSKDCDQPYL